MALRLHRVTDEQSQRPAAARRGQDLAVFPPRASIGAIEIELRALGGTESTDAADMGCPQAVAG